MLDLSSDITPPQGVRLADYRPSAFLIDTVDLVFDLGAQDTRVKSRLAIRRNPEAGERPAALELDGEELELVSVALDGAALGPNRYRLLPEGGLILADVPDAFTLELTWWAYRSRTATTLLACASRNDGLGCGSVGRPMSPNAAAHQTQWGNWDG
jgi:aminopeptidase N